MRENRTYSNQREQEGEPLGQDYTIISRNTDGTPRGFDGPGIVQMPDGLIVVVAPIKMPEHWVCQILHSHDGGHTWELVSDVPYYSAIPWLHDGKIYLFAHTEGVEKRNDDLHLLRSEDAGKTWSEPVTIARGHFWNCQTGMVRRDGKLYWAVDDLTPGNLRGPRVVCGDLTVDPLDPDAWRISNLITFPGLPDSFLWPCSKGSRNSGKMLEPNVIEVGGRIRVLMAVKPPRQSTTNLAAVFDLEDDGDTLRLSFTQYHPIPGGQVKFCVTKDDQTGLFWMTGNLAVDGQDLFDFQDPEEHRGGSPYGNGGNDRRFLMLFYGLDCLNWFPAGCIARARRLSQSFMYPAHIIDGDDLLVVARSSIQANNRHDADTCTFHRVKNFRKLAMDLVPEH